LFDHPGVSATTPSKQRQQGQTDEVFTTAPVEAPQATTTVQPIWIRLPKSGTPCPYTGLSRSALNALILGPKPLVKSVSLKKRYAVRGTRLIHLGSLLLYIESVAAEQNKTQ
jgi:hypothetical protein